jgi:hypothetical protein
MVILYLIKIESNFNRIIEQNQEENIVRSHTGQYKYSVETIGRYRILHTLTRKFIMKKFFNAIYEVLESMGRAKAAACLSRHGKYEEAKALMLKN